MHGAGSQQHGHGHQASHIDRAGASSKAEDKHNVPLRARSWLFSQQTLDKSPSRVDGLTEAEERRQRRAGCAHIQAIVKAVLEEPYRNAPKLADGARPTDTALETKMRHPAAAAMVLFNRFFARHSFARHDRFLVATACVFLGFKVEEQHQKIRYVINCSWDVWHGGRKDRLEQAGPEFKALRQSVLDTERILLYTLEFDIAVEHPFPLVREYLLIMKESGVFSSLGWGKAAKNKDAPVEVIHANAQAVNIAFECAASDICLRFTPMEIAVASLVAAFQYVCSSRNVPSPLTWDVLRRTLQTSALNASAALGTGMPVQAAAGSGAGAGSSSAGPNTAGSMTVGSQGQAAAPPLRTLQESTIHDLLSRYSQYLSEAVDASATLASSSGAQAGAVSSAGASGAGSYRPGGPWPGQSPFSQGLASSPFTPSDVMTGTPAQT